MLTAKAPTNAHPRRSASSYLLSGLVKCRRCGRALSGQAAKGGQFAYYVCQSLLHRGSGACDAPRLNARRFEGLIVEQLRDRILTADNLRALVRLVDAELAGVAHEQQRKLAGIETELAEVQRRLDRVWQVIETSDFELADATARIKARTGPGRSGWSRRRTKPGPGCQRAGRCWTTVETITAGAKTCAPICGRATARRAKAFIRSFVKEIAVAPGAATIRYAIPLPADSATPDRGARRRGTQEPGTIYSTLR